jgi:hypothetical protein
MQKKVVLRTLVRELVLLGTSNVEKLGTIYRKVALMSSA